MIPDLKPPIPEPSFVREDGKVVIVNNTFHYTFRGGKWVRQWPSYRSRSLSGPTDSESEAGLFSKALAELMNITASFTAGYTAKQLVSVQPMMVPPPLLTEED